MLLSRDHDQWLFGCRPQRHNQHYWHLWTHVTACKLNCGWTLWSASGCWWILDDALSTIWWTQVVIHPERRHQIWHISRRSFASMLSFQMLRVRGIHMGRTLKTLRSEILFLSDANLHQISSVSSQWIIIIIIIMYCIWYNAVSIKQCSKTLD